MMLQYKLLFLTRIDYDTSYNSIIIYHYIELAWKPTFCMYDMHNYIHNDNYYESVSCVSPGLLKNRDNTQWDITSMSQYLVFFLVYYFHKIFSGYDTCVISMVFISWEKHVSWSCFSHENHMTQLSWVFSRIFHDLISFSE